ARVGDVVDAGGLDVDAVEAGPRELRDVLVFAESTGNAPHPQLHVLPDFGRDVPANDDVGHGESSTRLQHAKRFLDDAVLVPGQVDDAVRDDYVHGIVGKRDILDLTLQELDVFEAALALVLL